MTVTVRPASDHDAAEAEQVGDQAFAATHSVYRPSEKAKANLATIAPALTRLVAIDNGRLVGTFRYAITGDCLRIVGLAVLPTHQRRGVGRALVESLARIAQAESCRALALFTVRQTGNVPIFERLGFRLVAAEQISEFSESVTGETLQEAYMECEISKLP